MKLRVVSAIEKVEQPHCVHAGVPGVLDAAAVDLQRIPVFALDDSRIVERRPELHLVLMRDGDSVRPVLQSEVARRDPDVDQVVLHPSFQVQPQGFGVAERIRRADGQQNGTPAFGSDLVGHAANPPKQVGEHLDFFRRRFVAQDGRFERRQMPKEIEQ